MQIIQRIQLHNLVEILEVLQATVELDSKNVIDTVKEYYHALVEENKVLKEELNSTINHARYWEDLYWGETKCLKNS